MPENGDRRGLRRPAGSLLPAQGGRHLFLAGAAHGIPPRVTPRHAVGTVDIAVIVIRECEATQTAGTGRCGLQWVRSAASQMTSGWLTTAMHMLAGEVLHPQIRGSRHRNACSL